MTVHSCMSDRNFRTDSRYGDLRLTKRTLFCISPHTRKSLSMSLKTVAQKLQVREGQKLLLVNPPQDYSELLAKQLPENVMMVKGTGEADVIQVFISSKSQLNEQLGKLRKLLHPKGILWVTYPKGTSKIKTDINRDIIRKEAERFGLEAVAIFSVDNDWSALRLKRA